MGIRRTKSDELDIFGQEPETATNDIGKAESSDYSQQNQERIEMLLIQNMETIKSLSQRINELSVKVQTIENNMDTLPYEMCKNIAETLKNVRFVGNLDPENYTKLKDATHGVLLEQKELQDEYIQKSEKQLDNHVQSLRKVLKDNEGIWLSSFGLKIWAVTFIVCVLVSFLHACIK